MKTARWMCLLAGWTSGAFAAPPSEPAIFRAAVKELRRPMCEFVPDCKLWQLGNSDRNLRVACAGIARKTVERTSAELVFVWRARRGGRVYLVDTSRFLPLCLDRHEALEGLEVLVDHDNRWSLVGYASVLEHDGTAQTMLGLALRAKGDTVGACEAFRKGFALDERAWGDNTSHSAAYLASRTCPSE